MFKNIFIAFGLLGLTTTSVIAESYSVSVEIKKPEKTIETRRGYTRVIPEEIFASSTINTLNGWGVQESGMMINRVVGISQGTEETSDVTTLTKKFNFGTSFFTRPGEEGTIKIGFIKTFIQSLNEKDIQGYRLSLPVITTWELGTIVSTKNNVELVENAIFNDHLHLITVKVKRIEAPDWGDLKVEQTGIDPSFFTDLKPGKIHSRITTRSNEVERSINQKDDVVEIKMSYMAF